jgi:hypothetical protein
MNGIILRVAWTMFPQYFTYFLYANSLPFMKWKSDIILHLKLYDSWIYDYLCKQWLSPLTLHDLGEVYTKQHYITETKPNLKYKEL